MTLLVASVAPDCAVLSQDSRIAGVPGFITAAIGMFCRIKICVLPSRRLAFGAAGCGGSMVMAGELGRAIFRAKPTIDGLEDILSEIWMDCVRRRRYDEYPFMVACVGWSPRRGCMHGIEADNRNRCKPRPIVGRHFLTPHPRDEDDPTWDAICDLNDRDLATDETLQLHRLIGLNCARSNRRGLYGSIALGGRLDSAVVTRDGVEVVDQGAL